MFEDQFDIKSFSGNLPVFPLPNVVFFPKTILPLHVFEMRYRQMVNDALAGEKLIGMALLKPGWEKNYYGNPEVYNVACMGKITEVEKLEDGRSNIILLGLKKVEIRGFVKEEPYRVAKAKIVEDIGGDDLGLKIKEKEELIDLFWKLIKEVKGKEFDKSDLDSSISYETLVNLVSSSLDISVYEKQMLLELSDLEERYKKIKDIIITRVGFDTILSKFRYRMPRDPKMN